MREHKEGDHRYVAIPTALTTVTFDIKSSNTSSSDTGTTKYFDNHSGTATQFDVVADQAIQIVGVNGTDFTDAVPVLTNIGYAEDSHIDLTQVKIKTTTANTNISIRVR